MLSVLGAALEKVPHYQDGTGNFIVGAADEAEYTSKVSAASASEPVRLFIAHTDHPGFHGLAWGRGGLLDVRWHGGAPVKGLIGSKVWVADKSGYVAEGTFRSVKIRKGRLESGIVALKGQQLSSVRADSLFGGFAFKAPVWKQGRRYYTKAADDLVGAFVITHLARTIWEAQDPARDRFLGLLTRAEEVGFIGAIAHFERNLTDTHSRKQVLCISLETSRTLPGAEIGKGPVLRLGDRATTFDAGCLQIFQRLAQGALKDRYQRRIMDGGTCEGTVGMAYGYPTLGISIPLGNYHNQNFEGGPGTRVKGGPAPEFVDSGDIQGMLKLCTALLEPGAKWDAPWTDKRRELVAGLERYRSLLG